LRRLDLYRFNNTTPAQLTDVSGQRYSYPRLSEFLYWQLGARLDNPGIIANTTKIQTFSSGDPGALGYHRQLISPDPTPSNLESIFFNAGSIYNPATDSLFRSVWNFGSRQTEYPQNKNTGLGFNGTGWMPSTWDFAREAIGQPLQTVPNRTV